MSEKRDKVNVDDIIGLIKTDEPTDSVTLKKEAQLSICEKRLIELEKENEQLKQYIYDNLDEDICDVCSYQYLEKSQMDKYYVAKCKKGYDNCSKGTVIHCKDFKFKELQE